VILEFFRWVEDTGFMTTIRESGLTYPIILSTHLTCIAIFGGLIVITDLRLLGAALTERSIADVVNGLRWWKRLGFVVMISMGIMLAGSKAVEYYRNPYFWTKMSLLFLVFIHAMIFRPSVYNDPEKLDASPVIPTRAKAAAVLSLVLWTSVVCAGRLIGYYEPPQPKKPAAAVGRDPRPATDARVGPNRGRHQQQSRTWGSGADGRVRPTSD
jgi:hypothetical protein